MYIKILKILSCSIGMDLFESKLSYIGVHKLIDLMTQNVECVKLYCKRFFIHDSIECFEKY
jgi:hypothetical protein